MLRITFAILILLSSIACSLNASNKKVKKQLTPTRFEQRVNELIAQMTLDEKISQLMNGSDGIERLGILPYDWWNEALHGVARNGRATVFPQAIGMAATFDTTLVHNIATAISDEARAKFNTAQKMGNYSKYAGLTFWTPNVNIFRDPRWGRGQETYGEDPYLTSCIGVTFARGLQGDHPKYLKTAACAKHFAVHSGPEALRHEFNVNPSRKDLYETYLPAFEALVKKANVEAVMGAYNRVYGESASGSQFLLKDILRDQWGFNGHIVSDCGAIEDIWKHHKIAKNPAEACAIAVKVGLNINCGMTYKYLHEAMDQKLITEEDIDRLLYPALMTRFKLGMFDAKEENPYNSIPESVVGSEKHVQLAHQAAAESMVLLQNRDNVLPLDKNIKKLYVTGPYAADVNVLMGNYYGASDRFSTFLQGIVGKVNLGTTVEYKIGILPTTPNNNPIDWTTPDAKMSDAIIVVLGESNLTEGEEGDAIASMHKGDRETIALPAHQIAFLKKLRDNNKKPIITVLTGGSPIALTEVCEYSDAVIMAWYPGQEGGLALGDVIFGDAVPSGRLPITFPVTEKTLPAYEDYSMKGRTYRYMSDNIMFPFGYGLSYTTFAYSDLKVTSGAMNGKKDITVEVTVKNTGNVGGREVVQLYLSLPKAGKSNPYSSLVAFDKVDIPAGGSKTVKFTVAKEQLQSVLENGSKKTLKGNYRLTASASAPSARSSELGATSVSLDFSLK